MQNISITLFDPTRVCVDYNQQIINDNDRYSCLDCAWRVLSKRVVPVIIMCGELLDTCRVDTTLTLSREIRQRCSSLLNSLYPFFSWPSSFPILFSSLRKTIWACFFHCFVRACVSRRAGVYKGIPWWSVFSNDL